jgi:hypothetical protein
VGTLSFASPDAFESIAQRPEVPPFETSLFPLSFTRSNQVLQTARTHNGRFAAFGATLVAPHSQLIFPLPRNGQLRKFILNPCSHLTLLI